jgi:hypothetical protein
MVGMLAPVQVNWVAIVAVLPGKANLSLDGY